MEISLINLKEIDNLFIVYISNGHFVSTGSFIANDFEGNEYFAHSSIVEKHNNKFFALKENTSSFFVLVEKEIWGGKWDNSEKSSIKFISDTKLECENYKDNLFYQKIIKYNLIDMEQSRSNSNDILIYNKESPYSNEIDILRKLLTDLNERID
jgi:hypothetical protein